MQEQLLIYVAGPYTAPTRAGIQDNMDAACEAGYAVMLRGHIPIIPHLSDLLEVWHISRFGVSPGYEFFMRWSLGLVRKSDGLLFLGPSPGADRELELALTIGKRVWGDVMEIPLATPD